MTVAASSGEDSEDALRALLALPVLEAARTLLGWVAVTTFEGKATAVRLTEVEAYAGDRDPASHAYNGRTARNGAMFGPPGTLYVYRSYGLHWCMNIVVAPEGTPHAVLLRGGEPIEGEAVMRARRGRADHLADGPGKLCQALGVTDRQNGTSVISGDVRLIEGRIDGATVLATPRIGISKATDRPWRYVVAR